MINWINSWGLPQKQWDKALICVRIAGLTLFEISVDLSAKKGRLMLLNFGFEFVAF